MDKFFENMDNRFKSIENELKYKFDSKFWEQAENDLNNAELDNAFANAAKQTIVTPNIDFNDIDDAFLDDAFIEAAKKTQFEYQSTYWNEFTQAENSLYFNDAFVTAAALSQVVYDANYWKEADLALQAEGLHHEYKPEYWKEVEQLLVQDARKGFFFKWGVAASILLLLSFLTYTFNQPQIDEAQTAQHHSKNKNDNHSTLQFKQIKDNVITNHVDKTIESQLNQEQLLNQKTNHNTSETNLKTTNTTSLNQSVSSSNNNNSNVTSSDVVTNHINYSSQNNNNINLVNNDEANNNVMPKNNAPSIDKNNIENENLNDFNENKDISTIHLNNKKLNHISTQHQPLQIEQKRIDLTALNTKPTHLLGIEVAKGIGNNFNNDNLSFRNSIYLSYTLIPFSPKVKNLSYGVDLGVYHQNLNEYEYETNYKVYHIEGNVDNYWYKMVYKDLVYFSSRANLYYTIANNHKLKLGFGVDKLMTSRIDMKYKKNNDFSPQSSNDQWGLNKAINNLDFSINLAYQLDINSKFAFTINAKHGILDKTNDDYLDRKKNDIDKSLLLGIKYTFLRTNK